MSIRVHSWLVCLLPFAFSGCAPSTLTPQPSTVIGRWTNSLGMIFVRFDHPDLAICVWETRVEDFQAFVDATGYDATQGMYSQRGPGWALQGHTWRNPGFEQGPAHPVVGVSWHDAQAFCQWLTEKERKEGHIKPTEHYRLPTDEEWSLAVGLPKENGKTPAEKHDYAKNTVWREAMKQGLNHYTAQRQLGIQVPQKQRFRKVV